MFVHSMTYEEIYRAISDEMHDAYAHYEKVKPKVDRALKKAARFPFCLYFSWEHPRSHNVYNYYVQSNRPAQWNNPFMSIFCEYEGEYGKEVLIPMPIPGRKDLLLQVFTSHFYKRYGERFLKDETDYRQIVMQYARRNFEAKSLGKECVSINEQQEETPGYNKESMLTMDGLCLGLRSDDQNITIFKTFVSFDQLFQSQYEKVWPMYLPYVCTLAMKSSPKNASTINTIYENGAIAIHQIASKSDLSEDEKRHLIYKEYEQTYQALTQYIM